MKTEPISPVVVALLLITITLAASTLVIWNLISANQNLWNVYVAVVQINDPVDSRANAGALETVRSFLNNPAFTRALEMGPDSGLDTITEVSLKDPATVASLADWLTGYIDTQITTAAYLVVLLGIVTGVLVLVLFATRSDLHRGYSIARSAHRLSHAVADTQDHERERIGRELHDNIGQLLSLVRIELTGGRTTEARHTLDTALAELRGLSRQLSLPAQSADDLSTELTELGRRLQESAGIPVSISVTGLEQSHSSIRKQAFRIAQELLTNGVKHARASRLDLRVLGVYPVLVLAYTDDGIGFDIEHVRTGVGLRSIQQRVELLGGSIQKHVLTPHGTGTKFRIELPLRGPEGHIQ